MLCTNRNTNDMTLSNDVILYSKFLEKPTVTNGISYSTVYIWYNLLRILVYFKPCFPLANNKLDHYKINVFTLFQPGNRGDDRALCFTCNVCLVCWEPTDEPW